MKLALSQRGEAGFREDLSPLGWRNEKRGSHWWLLSFSDHQGLTPLSDSRFLTERIIRYTPHKTHGHSVLGTLLHTLAASFCFHSKCVISLFTSEETEVQAK